MEVQSIVRYLKECSLWEHEKPYYIHGHRAKELPRDNYEQSEHNITVFNARLQQEKDVVEKSGFEWTKLTPASRESLSTQASIDRYIVELTIFIQDYFSAETVLPYEYQIRKAEVDLSAPFVRRPARMAHIDVTPWSARMQLLRKFPLDGPRILKDHFIMLSVWRPLFGPLEDMPLAVCDARTIEKDRDLVEADYIYPDFEGENTLATFHANHRWVYLHGQMADELLMIKNFDSANDTCCLHAAFEHPDCPPNATPRHSVEVRVFVAKPQRGNVRMHTSE